MSVVWQNSFDGPPGTLVSDDLTGPGTSGQWGDAIVNLRNSADVSHVRYGDQAYHGRASLALGATTAFSGNHGDVQLTPPLGEWSISFYLYRTGDGWVRILQDGLVNISDLYLDYGSGAHFVGWTEIPASATDELHDRWVRVEGAQSAEEMTWRFWWTDPDSTGSADYEITVESTAPTSGYLFVQGGGSEAAHPPAYIDSVRVGEGEWLGPWGEHRTTTARATLTLAGTAQARGEATDRTTTARGTLSLSGTAQASSEEGERVTARATLDLAGTATAARGGTTSARGTLGLSGTGPVSRRGTTSARGTLHLSGIAQARRGSTTTAPATLFLSGTAEANRHTTTSATGRLELRGRAVPSADASLALDYAASHLAPPFEPVDDDTDVVNRVQASRRDGGEETYSIDEGPLSTADPPEGVGVYGQSVTLDVDRDEQLGEQAAWRVHLGTTEGYRYPSVSVNLVGNPQLVEAVATRDTGDALQIINPPEWLPPGSIELMIEGYNETINTHQWVVEFNASPGAPWNVGQVLAEQDGEPVDPGESQANRADTAGCELAADLGEQATEFDAWTYQGPRWITSAEFADEMPFDVAVGGELMRVQSITGTGQTQVFTVIRAINGIRLTHPAGVSVALAQPAVVAL